MIEQQASYVPFGYKPEWHATITRCGCGNPAAIHPNAVCPTPKEIVALGRLRFWAIRNPIFYFKSLFNRLTRLAHKV